MNRGVPVVRRPTSYQYHLEDEDEASESTSTRAVSTAGPCAQGSKRHEITIQAL